MGRTLQDAPESINIFTSFPPIFIVARILFGWLSTALISFSVQDTEKRFPVSSFFFVWLLFWEHLKAKWFCFWQAEQICPKAGHFYLSFSCVWPQNRKSFTNDDLSAPLDGFLTKFTSRGEGSCEFCADIASSWVDVASALRHISIHFSSVSSGTWNSFFLELLSRTWQTILSVIISSLSVPKLQVSERDLKIDA